VQNRKSIWHIKGIEFEVVLWMLAGIQITLKRPRASFAHELARNGVQGGGIEGMLTQNLTGE